jgi:signal recognition particle receptor subunit alpha
MVYELGQPIVFVGVGQTYQDLKVINADVVVSALMQ